MKKWVSLIVLLTATLYSWGWGATGHRVVGQIASNHLSKKAQKAIKELIDEESLATASTWMDEIKSDTSSFYKKISPWHYVSIPDGMTYEQSEKSSSGDIIEAIQRLTADLKNTELPKEKRVFALRCLIHLVGDIHQPLHVGRKDDRGGNSIKVEWFRKSSNLHRVWDSEMIDSYNMSYTELATNLDHASKEEVETWQNHTVLDWANESMAYRSALYEIGEGKLGYRYSYVHFHMVKKRLLQGGIRLAGLLNEAFE